MRMGRRLAQAVRGSTERGRLAAVLAFAAALVCLLLPAPALAALPEHPFLETFGSAEHPKFEGEDQVQAMAVDQSTGDLLVYHGGLFAAGKISRFNPDGTPANFSALSSTNTIDGKAGEADATPQGNLSVAGGPSVTQVAIDNSGGAANGHIYATYAGVPVIDIFTSNGAYFGQLTKSSEGNFGEPCGVAVDPSGNVYVGDAGGGGTIHVFSPSGTNTLNFEAAEPCTVAAGAGPSAGSVFVTKFEGPVTKYTTAGKEPCEVSSGANTTVSVDPSSGHLYVAKRNEALEFDASGSCATEVSKTVIEKFGAPIQNVVTGIAANGATGNLYLHPRDSTNVEVYGPAPPPPPPLFLPEALSEDADAIAAATATLHGTVHPKGKALSDCRFEYGTTASYGESAPCVPAAASIPPDESAHAVSAEIGGLSPDTTYHFRLVAANSEGSVDGADRTLLTAIGPPAIVAQSVEALGSADAVLSAKINPEGAATTYHVEYGPTAAYGNSTPESAPIGFPGDKSVHTVSVHVGGLAPGSAYHFRFVASSPAGSAEGADTSFATYPTPPTFGPCPNDQYRSGFGARLPDCRAYEQATPADKHGANIQGPLNTVEASSAGDRIDFYLLSGLPTSGGSSNLSAYLASRGAGGWSSDGLLPATEPSGGIVTSGVVGWSEDLSTSLSRASGALYLRDSDTAAFEPVPGFGSGATSLAGFAADTSHLIFESTAHLLPGAAGEDSLYELDHGALSLAGRVPAGSATSCDDEAGPACEAAPNGSFAGPYNWQENKPGNGGALQLYYTQNTISRDGSRVFFTAAGNSQLYLREDGTRTTRVSASQRAVPDPNGEKPAAFMAATPDGSKAFFTSCEKLTDDSTAFSTGEGSCTAQGGGGDLQGQDLYSYDTGTGQLTDLTVDSNAGDAKGAAVVGVLGASADGSYVYFVANGVLAEGASPGNCAIGGSGVGGECNLYVSHDGAVAFIASLKDGGGGKAGDANDWRGNAFTSSATPKTSRVSADGRTLLFGSERSLTGYDNTGLCGGSQAIPSIKPCQELFRYSAPSKELTCVSCNPAGLPPGGNAVLGTERNAVATLDQPKSTFLTRNLSADGNRVFFDSLDALVPTDTNGKNDVYEWEAKGSGSCESESQDGGCIYLISSGTSPDPSFFADASANGDHAFFFTSQQLVPSDHDELVDIYDAGVGGGLAAQHALAPPTCSGAACQANPAPPPDQPFASAAVLPGSGNVHEPPPARKCPKGKRQVRSAGKLRCQKAHKRHNKRGGSK
jgi:hypothetical protein